MRPPVFGTYDLLLAGQTVSIRISRIPRDTDDYVDLLRPRRRLGNQPLRICGLDAWPRTDERNFSPIRSVSAAYSPHDTPLHRVPIEKASELMTEPRSANISITARSQLISPAECAIGAPSRREGCLYGKKVGQIIRRGDRIWLVRLGG